VKKIVIGSAMALITASALAGTPKPPRCTYSIAPTTASVGASSASGSIAVTTAAGCSWTATSNQAFVSVVGGATGSGSGTVTYQVDANTGSTSRTGTITVARKTFTLTQAAAPAPALPPPPPPPPALDPAFGTGDVGNVGLVGDATSAGGTFTVTGAGADIWGSADSFRFVYQQLTGDGQLVARVVSMQNTNVYAKAGIMLRDSLAAGGAHVILDMKPSGELEFMARATSGGSTSWLAGVTGTAPIYLKLARAGSTVTSSVSQDGSLWTIVGSATAVLPATVYAGLVVCSHDTSLLNTASFDSVSISSSVSSSQNQAPTADAGPAQTVAGGSTVVLSGSGYDPESQPLSFAWSQVAGAAVTLSSSSVASPTFVAPAASSLVQTLTFQIVVNDGIQDSSPSRVSITIAADTTAPPPPPPAGSLLPAPPSGGATIAVPVGADLQAAINAAQPGDVIVLDAGATYSGNFELPAKGGASYVMIRSSAAFAEGTRVTPATAGLAKVVSPNAYPAVITQAGASFYWLEGLEMATAGGANDVLRLGDGSSAQNTLSMVPHDLVVSHCYIHGRPGIEQKRGIALNSGSTYIADSHVDEIKGAGYDTQAIGGWNGPGPYRIYNNYLSAAGEVFMLGGDDPKIVNLVPTDIVFKGNLLTRPTSWRGSSWTVKNIFELKNARQVSIDGNLFEYNWQAAQPGPAIVFTPRNQGGGAPWVVVRDVQFVNNRVRHVAAVFNVLGYDNVNPSLPTENIRIANNVFEDVSAANWGGTGRLLLINGGNNITLDHNTTFQDGSSFVYAYGSQTTGFTFTSNIVPHGAYGIFGDASSPGMGAINQYFPAGVVTGNLIVASKASYPSGNYYPATMADVGFVNLGGGDYRLTDTSPYKRTAADGTDPGADPARIPR
jgi:hypothetical protein